VTTERTVAEQLDVRLMQGDRIRIEKAALGYGSGRPFELILGFGGPAWSTHLVDVSVAIAGVYCPPDSPAGRGDVRIYRCSEGCVAIELHSDEGTAEAHYPADVFCGFVDQVVELYEDPEPVADDVLAAQIDEWSTDAT
jgi:hypothetical protein